MEQQTFAKTCSGKHVLGTNDISLVNNRCWRRNGGRESRGQRSLHHWGRKMGGKPFGKRINLVRDARIRLWDEILSLHGYMYSYEPLRTNSPTAQYVQFLFSIRLNKVRNWFSTYLERSSVLVSVRSVQTWTDSGAAVDLTHMSTEDIRFRLSQGSTQRLTYP